MDWELLSGPDLGGGFLFQLTIERSEPDSRFFFHAQPGGQDAGGPPEGTPEPLGYERVSSACPLGGRVCWHRSFWLPAGHALAVRNAYNRTRLMMAARVRQSVTEDPEVLEFGLINLLEILRDAGGTAVPWVAHPTLALWLRTGRKLPPTLRLELEGVDVPRLAELLGPYLIEPAARTLWPPGEMVYAGRAFLGTVQRGVAVEWRNREGPSPATEAMSWRGFQISVPAAEG